MFPNLHQDAAGVETGRVVTMIVFDELVGAWRFEPRTSCAQGRRATRLRYAPTSTRSYSNATCDSSSPATCPLLRNCAKFTRFRNIGRYVLEVAASKLLRTAGMCEVRLQPDLRPPPTRCLRDSLPREDSSAPCCINFFPPRRSRFPRKTSFSVFLVFFFLAIAARCPKRSRTSVNWRQLLQMSK